ncbi:MAG: glycosyltransferase family 4 protein [Sphingobacteriaceae bacterium]|nr:glycosyltransferase family 4 protein [Sphingobacteriaceae bacterium]
MKVLHLNTYEGNGGAGRACLRLSDALNEQGVESEIMVYFQFSPSHKTINFSAIFFRKIKAVCNILAERYLTKIFVKAVKTPFSLQFFGQAIANHPALKSADIIHLHWINHGFLTPKNLEELSKLNKPIVWTFHDSNAFTGGCHVRYACQNFLKECGNCPLLKSSSANDISHKNWLKKKKAYSKLDFSVVAPSRWMANSAKKSSLLQFKEVSVIPNTIEIEVFKPYPKSEAKVFLGIEPHKFVLMSGFMPSKNDKHKGAQYLIEALNLLAQNPAIEKGNVELVIFGNKSTENMPEFPFKTTFLGNISNDTQLAQSYSAADAFITPSLEDNLPNTVMESLACATPVIAFETGGIPDMVSHLENGYLAKYESAEDLAAGIAWLYSCEIQLLIQQNARESILKNFAPEVIAKKHIELYNSVLNNKK